MYDPVNHPRHYMMHPSGIECIQVAEHMNFCLGNALKYIWRAGEKGNRLQDLKKARWYLDREIQSAEKAAQAVDRRDESPAPSKVDARNASAGPRT